MHLEFSSPIDSEISPNEESVLIETLYPSSQDAEIWSAGLDIPLTILSESYGIKNPNELAGKILKMNFETVNKNGVTKNDDNILIILSLTKTLYASSSEVVAELPEMETQYQLSLSQPNQQTSGKLKVVSIYIYLTEEHYTELEAQADSVVFKYDLSILD